MLYKYRSLSNEEQYKFFWDIIENNRLYFPTRSELNDPLEGMKQPIYANVMGVTRYQELGLIQPEVEAFWNKYRIVSLCSEWDNMQMWAHYGGNYNGICIGFHQKETFKDAMQMSYGNGRLEFLSFPSLDCISKKTEEQLVLNNLFSKSRNWRYEKEWRIVRKTDEHFLKFDKTEIEEIIIGNIDNFNDDFLAKLNKICTKREIPLFFIRTNVERYQLEKHPFNYFKYKNDMYNKNAWDIVEIKDGKTRVLRMESLGNSEVNVSK